MYAKFIFINVMSSLLKAAVVHLLFPKKKQKRKLFDEKIRFINGSNIFISLLMLAKCLDVAEQKN